MSHPSNWQKLKKTKQNWRYPMWTPRLMEEQIRPLDRGMMWYLARLKASISMT